MPIEFAAEILDPNKPGWPTIAKYHSVLDIPADATLQPGAMQMHRDKGRGLNFFHTRGQFAGYVYEQVVDFILEHVNRQGEKDEPIKMVPAGHNAARFDIPLLWKDAFRYGIDMDKVLDHHFLDTAGMAYERFMFRSQELKKVSLKLLAQHLGVTVDAKETHKAAYDVELTAAVLRILMDVPPAPKTLEQVFAEEDKHGA